MFVFPQNWYVVVLTSKVMELGGGPLEDDQVMKAEPPWVRLVPFQKKSQKALLSLPTCEDTVRRRPLTWWSASLFPPLFTSSDFPNSFFFPFTHITAVISVVHMWPVIILLVSQTHFQASSVITSEREEAIDPFAKCLHTTQNMAWPLHRTVGCPPQCYGPSPHACHVPALPWLSALSLGTFWCPWWRLLPYHMEKDLSHLLPTSKCWDVYIRDR